MAFSGSSYFAGVGTVFAAIGIGVACGMMITHDVVQPPNRVERVNAGAMEPPKVDATPSTAASPGAEQANTAKPSAQDVPSPAVATAPSAPAPDPQPAPQPQPPTAVTKTDAATSTQDQPTAAASTRKSAPAPVAKGDDQAPAKGERTTVGRAGDPSRAADQNREASRSADQNRDVPRKRSADRKYSDDHKYSERRRRQDQDERRLDEATNAARQLPPGEAIGEIVRRDEPPPRPAMRPHRFELFGDDDDSPRVVREPPPRFGFFGD